MRPWLEETLCQLCVTEPTRSLLRDRCPSNGPCTPAFMKPLALQVSVHCADGHFGYGRCVWSVLCLGDAQSGCSSLALHWRRPWRSCPTLSSLHGRCGQPPLPTHNSAGVGGTGTSKMQPILPLCWPLGFALPNTLSSYKLGTCNNLPTLPFLL